MRVGGDWCVLRLFFGILRGGMKGMGGGGLFTYTQTHYRLDLSHSAKQSRH